MVGFSVWTVTFNVDFFLMLAFLWSTVFTVMSAVLESGFLSITVQIVHPDFSASSLVLLYLALRPGFHANFIAGHSQFSFSETGHADATPASVHLSLESSAEYVVVRGVVRGSAMWSIFRKSLFALNTISI
jgi:hypothetical protein